MAQIISNYTQRFKKDAFAEFSHTFCDKAGECQTVTQQLGEWYDPYKTAVDEMLRIYYITLRSPLTEEISATDSQRDHVITGLKAFNNSFLKSRDGEELAAAKKVELGLKGIRLNSNDQYIAQTAQIDNLLHYLQEEIPEAVEKLGLTAQVQQLKTLNDYMHELIEGRVAEREDKVLGAFEFARNQTETCYHDFVKGVNSWAYINGARLTTDARDLGEFISWANALIEVYKEKVIHIPVNTPDAGDAEKDPDDPTTPPDVEQPDGEPTTPPAGGSGSNGGTGSGSGNTGSGSGSNGNESGSGSGSTETDPEKYTVAWYTSTGNPIIWYELAPGETIPDAPTPPTGYRWPTYPSVMPNHDLDIIPEPKVNK